MGHGGGGAAHAAAAAAAEAGNNSLLRELSGGDMVTILVTVTVVLRVINYHYFRWPASIMMAIGSLGCTLVLLVLAKVPSLPVEESLSDLRIMFMDFPDLVLNYMLGFLLFAGAIEVNVLALGRIRSTIIALSLFTTFISAGLVSVLTYLLLLRTSKMDFAWCMLYGAIVSPTDPVAVISILNDKPTLLPSSTKYFVLGESLLNDAVGVVLYLVFSEIVVQPDMDYWHVSSLFFKGFVLECVLGIIIGLSLAWIAYSTIKSLDGEPLLEVAISFVLVANINLLCRMVDASIPLASVTAGLLMGNYCVGFAMSSEAVETFQEMWKLLDETLNSVLFLLIGFADLFWQPQEIGWIRTIIIGLCTICISLFARLISVACPLFFIIFVEWLTGKRLRHPAVRYRGGTIAVLTWGGMRGGISIALALGVPDAFVQHALPGHMTYGQLIFFMTFALVVFSICVQGFLFENVVNLINALSYEFPSPGLGTFYSRMNLNTEDEGEPEDKGALHYDDYDVDSNGERIVSEGGEHLAMQASWSEAGGDDDADGSDGYADNLIAPPQRGSPALRSLPPPGVPPRGGPPVTFDAPASVGFRTPNARGAPVHRTTSFGAGHDRLTLSTPGRGAAHDGVNEWAARRPPGPGGPSVFPSVFPLARDPRFNHVTNSAGHAREQSGTFRDLASPGMLPSIDEVLRRRFQRPGDPSQSRRASAVLSTRPSRNAAAPAPDVGGALRRSHTVHGSDPSIRAPSRTSSATSSREPPT